MMNEIYYYYRVGSSVIETINTIDQMPQGAVAITKAEYVQSKLDDTIAANQANAKAVEAKNAEKNARIAKILNLTDEEVAELRDLLR